MLICFFDINGIVHKESVPPGQTINAKFYCNVLRRLREDMRGKWPNKWCTNKCVFHNNAPAHSTLAVQQFLASKNMMVIPPPPYSPELVPCDFLLFPKMKIKFKGQIFDTIKGIKTKLQKVLKTMTQKDFQNSFDHGRNVGIVAYAPKGTTLKWTVVIRTMSVSYFSSNRLQEVLITPHIVWWKHSQCSSLTTPKFVGRSQYVGPETANFMKFCILWVWRHWIVWQPTNDFVPLSCTTQCHFDTQPP